MLTGILMAVTAGLIWSLSGVANSSCARYKLDIFTYLLANVSFSMLLTAVFFVDFRQLGTVETGRLACVMIPSGLLNTGGALMLQKALQRGHHGIIFLISQSALVMPFLFGVVVMGEPTTVTRCCGASLIFVGMACCALPKIQWQAFKEDRNSRIWLLDALLAFLLFGVAQSLMTLPSYWEGFQDHAQARTTLLYLGSTALMVGMVCRPSVRHRLTFSRALILCGVAVSILNSLSMRLIFCSLDTLAGHDMRSIGFSLAIASSLVGFTLYSLLFLRETCYTLTLVGLGAIVAGGVLIS